MTPLLIALLRRELEPLLLSSRLSQVSQSSNETVELLLYHPNRPHLRLVAALLPQKPLFFLTEEKYPALPKPPNFCRSLRKHLEYAQLTGLASILGERILELIFKTSEGNYRLVFEGIHKYPNLILVGPNNCIISAMRYRDDTERPVLPNTFYAPPPQPLEKPDLWSQTGEALKELWQKDGHPPLIQWLKDHFRGTDPEFSSHLGSFGETFFQDWGILKERFVRGEGLFVSLFEGPPPVLKLFPDPSHRPEETRTYPSVSQALEAYFKLEASHRKRLSIKTRLEGDIHKALKHEKRILEKLKKDRAEAERSDQYQWWGELLMAQLHKVKFHSKEVELPDVVRGGPDPVRFLLDPELTPLQNAQRFFKKAQKGSRGLALVEAREKEIQERTHQLKSAQRSLPALQTPEEIKKASQELFPKRPEATAKPKKPKEEKVPTPNILKVRLDKGFELCAGTSAAANDYVTFQLAQPEDLWFHVRDLPGSHVILRRLQRDTPVTQELLLKAAQTAAFHCKAETGSKVTVSFTEKKFVKRIPGAPLGMVSLSHEKSLVVEVPDQVPALSPSNP